MTIPADTRRLFDSERAGELELERHAPAIIERLLEDGDSSDLFWLTGVVSEARLATWFRKRAPRRLSRRSRAFWALLLELPNESGPGERVWPL